MPDQRHAVLPQAEDRADGGAQQHGGQRPGKPGPPGLRDEQEHEHRRGDQDVTRIHLRQPAANETTWGMKVSPATWTPVSR